MSKHLSTTFDQHLVSLTEYLDQPMVDKYFAEALSLYCSGFSVEKVAETILYLDDKPAD